MPMYLCLSAGWSKVFVRTVGAWMCLGAVTAMGQDLLLKELNELKRFLSLTSTQDVEVTGEFRPEPKILSPEQSERQKRIAACLAIYFQQQVNADTLRPWSIMHGLIAYGPESQTLKGGRSVNTIEYLCANGAGDGMQILYLEGDQIRTRQGPGVQGHEGQLLAMFAQTGVSADHPLSIEGQSFTVQDLVEFEKRGCESGKELTFKLLSLCHYVHPDEIWLNHQGQVWSISRLIKEELGQKLTEGACGGTHGLMALSHAISVRREKGLELNGEWAHADAIVEAYQRQAFSLQNVDGSFSTRFFLTRDSDPDLKARLYSSGHILEWMAYSLSEGDLDQSRVTAAVDFLCNLMLNAPGHALDVGPRGHAIHALAIYHERAFGFLADYADSSLIAAFPTPPMVPAKLPAAAKDSNGRTPASPASYENNRNRRGVLRRR